MDEYIAVFADMYGISEDDRGKAERCIESTIEYIKNYCHIDSIPDDLKHTVILMAADLFRYDISASSGRYDNVTSIKEAMLRYRTAVIQAVCRACLKTTKQGLHVSESWCGDEYGKRGD